MTTPRHHRGDIEAALAARRELGPDYDDAFADAVAERIEAALYDRPRSSHPRTRSPAEGVRNGNAGGVAIALASLAAAIPLTAIAANFLGLSGVLLTWAGIVMINIAHALRR